MHAVMRYTVKPDQLDLHLDLLGAVYQELMTTDPGGIVWTTYRVADSSTFVEVIRGADLPHPLPQLPAFQRYRAGLDDRCEAPPEFTEVAEVGAYPTTSCGG